MARRLALLPVCIRITTVPLALMARPGSIPLISRTTLADCTKSGKTITEGAVWLIQEPARTNAPVLITNTA